MMDFLFSPLPEEIEIREKNGDFKGALRKIEEYSTLDFPTCMRLRLEYEKERILRVKKEYSVPFEKAKERVKREIKNVSEREIERWLADGTLDCMPVDGRMRCFSRFLDNMFFADPQLSKRRVKKKDTRVNGLILQTLIRMSSGELRRYRIRAGIRVKIRKKHEGSKFRVWLPVPKEGFQVEKVKILSSSYSYVSDAPQRTAYFETKEREVKIEFEYVISEVAGGLEGAEPGKYKGEKNPHIIFTPYLKNLAQSIVEDEDSNMEKTKKIYQWVTSHMRYFYVKNYGIYENISQYAASNLKGDCGFHAILFISLARILGIPAKWQSGWFVTPYYIGPHDWAQVYVDGKWYPVDASFGNLNRHTKVENEFYFGNLDAFRMVANDDILADFTPNKRFWRSDPVDNQVGEVESGEKNLYYGDFSWKMYLKEMKKI